MAALRSSVKRDIEISKYSTNQFFILLKRYLLLDFVSSVSGSHAASLIFLVFVA